MRRTTRIPVYRQPPVWLVACVVLAALSPVLLRAVGIEPGPRLDVARVSEARAGEPDTVALLPRAPVVAASRIGATAPTVGAPAPADAIADEDVLEDDEDDEAEETIVIVEEPAEGAEPDRMPDQAPAVAREIDATALAAAKAACRRGNKDAARAVYRDLPRGDARRKQIRKACRQEGVWIL